MKIKKLLFIISFTMFACLSNKLKAQVDVKDSLALVDLYNSTGGAGWLKNTNWLTKQPVSTWHGIYVVNNRVSIIFLQYNNVTGKIPSSIGDLDSLDNLALYHNSISDSLPSSIGNLSHLEFLDVSYNQFSGAIPSSITRLKKLQQLTLHENRFTGKIPSDIGNLELLENFTAQHNRLSGLLPKSLGNLKKLFYFDLSYNKLTGEIPASLGNDTLLGFVYLHTNKLSGSLPSSLSHLSQLRYLYLQDNELSGTIPVSYGDLSGLFDFRVSNNNLTGGIPGTFAKLKVLGYLYAKYNHLTEDRNENPHLYSYVSVDISHNNFTFNGLEFLAGHIPNSSYAPQAHIRIHRNDSLLAVSAGGTLPNNIYKWYRAGTAMPVVIEHDSTFAPPVSGQYFVHVLNSEVPFLVLKSDTVNYSVSTNNNDRKISLSPNPARGMIWVRGLDGKKEIKITITDMSGYVWMIAMSHEQPAIQLDISRLKAGNYWVSVSDRKEVKTIQLVKE